MTDYSSVTLQTFGSGYSNTGAMITKWNDSTYGEQTTAGSYTDMWGLSSVQTGYANGWFVPSREEWCAFCGVLGVTRDNYQSDFGLSYAYWSSSQGSETRAFMIWIDTYQYCLTYSVSFAQLCVRLSTVF